MIRHRKIRWIKTIVLLLMCCGLLGVLIILFLNLYIKASVKDQILSLQEAKALEEVDCILVLGAGVWSGNRPSPMLEDRLNQGIELYREGVSNRLLMSGDHGRKEYDEVNVMKSFAIEKGIRSEDIFMDHAGFSTYDSMYRARDIFQSDKIVIVTQGYHMYRALYVANQLGIEAYGVASDPRMYSGQNYRELREMLARGKDSIFCLLRLKPTYLGEAIPVSGNGDITNDK